MLSPNIFNILFVFPLINILVAFYKVFSLLRIPGALGWAILGLTLFVKALTYPFFKKQMQAAKKMQELQPQLQKLQKKHKDDPQKLQKAQIELYKQAGVNPASGCLLALVQIPIFIGLYQSFSNFLKLKRGGEVSFRALRKILYFKFLEITSIDPNFFGIDLTLTPAQAGQPIYFLIPVITGVLQYYMSVVSSSGVQTAESKEMSDFQKAFQMQSKIIFPLFIAWISFRFPVGLSLYWNFFTLLSILQMRKINR